MNRIGRMVIGGISEMAATNGASTARARGMSPAGTPSPTAISAEMAMPPSSRARLGAGIGPEQIVAGARLGHEGETVDRRRHLPERGQQLVVRDSPTSRRWLPMA